MLAFTIGPKMMYNRAVKNKFLKKGRRFDYPGGCVWRRKEEAEKYLRLYNNLIDFGSGPEECSVYGLLLREEDISKDVDEEGIHYLLTDSRLVKLKEPHETTQIESQAR